MPKPFSSTYHTAIHGCHPMDDHWRFLLLDWRKLICSYYQADQSLIIKRRVMQIKSLLHHMCPLKVSIWNSWLLVIERMQNVSKRQNSKTFCQLPSERHVRLTLLMWEFGYWSSPRDLVSTSTLIVICDSKFVIHNKATLRRFGQNETAIVAIVEQNCQSSSQRTPTWRRLPVWLAQSVWPWTSHRRPVNLLPINPTINGSTRRSIRGLLVISDYWLLLVTNWSLGFSLYNSFAGSWPIGLQLVHQQTNS